MYFRATEPHFLPGDTPLWQFTVMFTMYELTPHFCGSITVDGKSGVPVPLSSAEITAIKEQAHVITGH
jgi:hypothetical protein